MIFLSAVLVLLNLLFVVFYFCPTAGSSDRNPHDHRGVLPQFDGSILPCKMSKGQEERLAKEEPISAVDKSTGKAFVVQDVAADPSVCMKFIKEIQHYDKYVKSVKKVGIYEKCRDIMGAETSKGELYYGISVRFPSSSASKV